MTAHPEFGMPDGRKRFGAYEYPSGKGSNQNAISVNEDQSNIMLFQTAVVTRSRSMPAVHSRCRSLACE